MAQIIDMFTRQPVPEKVAKNVASMWSPQDYLTEFIEMSKADRDTLSDEDQEWFCSVFRETYLSDLTDAVRGIDEADNIDDLEAFLSDLMKAIEALPKVSRA